MPTSTRRRLLALLADRQFHSGESLGSGLAMSRAAIWKQIQTLQTEGLLIETNHAQGSRLQSQIELLDRELIVSLLPAAAQQQIRLEIYEELESSNQHLMQNRHAADSGSIPVCLAERQTAGRGRRGRSWQTPYGTALALSLLWRFEGGAGELTGLSLAVGVAVSRVLVTHGVSNAQLKWPNDVVCRDQKLAGILIEVAGDAGGPCNVVIGIGLNISNSTTDTAVSMPDIEQAWTDVYSQAGNGSVVSRNHIAAGLIDGLLTMLRSFANEGFAPYREEYARIDALSGRQVSVQQAGREITGIACGVDESGGLLLRLDGQMMTVTSGDVSVRKSAKQ